MSGHSKWHRIKHKKAATDAKRGQQFTQLATHIQSAARSEPDPDKNPALREAINRAKQANMPQANIDRLLNKAGADKQTTTYEAFGPSGIALLITTTTDNNKRTVSELRTILKKHSATLSQPGSVTWKFETESGKFKAKYPQTVDATTKDKINQLIKELTNHPDITSTQTDLN